MNTFAGITSSFIKKKKNNQWMLLREALDPTKRTPKCERLLCYNLNGPVSGWETSEAPSSEPRSRCALYFERPFACSVEDCHVSYRRKDHLNRHLLRHQGKRFKCPIENCNTEFAFQGNMTRHRKEFHDEESSSYDAGSQKQFVCQEVGCGKVFKFASKLKKHEDSHVKLDSVEAYCSEPGCMKYFNNEQCLKAHVQSCHAYINCHICGAKQLKKNIKRHLQSHESGGVASARIKCDFEGCPLTFLTKSNMRQHVKSVNEALKPYACSFGCGMSFSYKHVRDNHEKSGFHVYTPGDFLQSDEQFRSRPRGGRKRTCPTVEMLVRKE